MKEKAIYLPKELLARSVTGAELTVYAILTFCGKKWVRIPYRTLSARSGMSAPTVCRALKGLLRKELISCKRGVLNGHKQTNSYKVLLRAGSTDFFCLPERLIGAVVPNALLLFAVLSAHTNRFGDCRMSERRLAKETGLSRGTVRTHSSFLTACGALLRQARFYAKKRLTNARRCFAFSLFSRSSDEGWYNFLITRTEQTKGFPNQKRRKNTFLGRLHPIGVRVGRKVKDVWDRLANRMRRRSAKEPDAAGRFLFSFLLLRKGARGKQHE